MIKAALLHLSNHMWQKKGALSQPYKHYADFGWYDTLKCDKKVWTDITNYMAESGFTYEEILKTYYKESEVEKLK